MQKHLSPSLEYDTCLILVGARNVRGIALGFKALGQHGLAKHRLINALVELVGLALVTAIGIFLLPNFVLATNVFEALFQCSLRIVC